MILCWVLLAFALVLVLPVPAIPATITVGPSNCSAAAMNSAIAAAADGDTLQVTCTGTVTWDATVTVPPTKGLLLRGGGNNTPKTSATFPLTISSRADPLLLINCENNRALNRVTGFKFQNTIASTKGAVFVQGRGKGATGIGCFRLDNNYFDSIQLPHADLDGTVTVWASTGVLTGLIDNNTFHDASYTDGYAISIEERWQFGGSGWPFAGQNAWTRPLGWGTSDFIFIEDNLIENISQYTRHLIEAIQGAKYVVRYNTFNTNRDNAGTQSEQVEAHGFCFCQSIGHGTRGGEVYQNIFDGMQVANSVLLRGGTWLVYDNTWNKPPSGSFIFLREYRAGSAVMFNQCDSTCPSAPAWANAVTDALAYPMSEQIGADLNRNPSPSYFWNNQYQGVNQNPDVDRAGVQSLFIVAGRDYFSSTSKPAALSSYTPYPYPHPLRATNSGSTPSPPNTLKVQ
jgi:hypothetical protein